jgi:hypothetical protein
MISGPSAAAGSSVSTGQKSSTGQNSSTPDGQSIEEQAMRLALRDMSPSQRGQALSDYLHNHRLPLVGVQYTNAADGARQVVLYGYVATKFGKSDAEKKVRAIIDDPNVAIVNRIEVRPEIASMGGSGNSAESSASASQPNDLQEYQNQQALQQYQNQQGLQQYQQQSANNWLSLMLPLLGFGFGSGFGGGSTSFGFGGSPSPYFGAPYNPYPYGQPDPFMGPNPSWTPYP